MAQKIKDITIKMIPRPLANSAPTDDLEREIYFKY